MMIPTPFGAELMIALYVEGVKKTAYWRPCKPIFSIFKKAGRN